MKIVFMGTPVFAVPSLEILLKNGYCISAVVTVPDKEKGRGLTKQFSDVKKFALEKNLPILQPDNLKDETFINKIKKYEPDLIIVVAFRILPREIYTISKFGTFNLHASLLPKYRGAAPINRAIINGDKETGVTTFFLEDKVDTGNIILQKIINIDEDDNAGTLHDKLSILGAETVLQTVKLIETGNLQLIKQDNSLSSKAPKIFKDDCRINWNQSSEIIHNFIRGLSPYPVAFTIFDEKLIKIYKSNLTHEISNGVPGSALVKDKNLYINTIDYLLQIIELQIEGKKRVRAIDFINGLKNDKILFK